MFHRVVGQAGVTAVVEHHAVLATGVGAAVVRREQDDGVVQFTDVFEILDQLADILVGIVEHACKCFHVARIQRPILGVGVIPQGCAWVGCGQLGVRRDQPHLDLPFVACLARRRPAHVVFALVLGHIRRLGLQRRVHGIVGDVEEERFGRVALAQFLDEADALIHPVVTGVVVARILVYRQHLVAQHQACREKVVGFTIHEAVIGVETALRRPVVLRPALRIVRRRRVVPLADHDGFVSGCAQGFGQGCGFERDLARVPRIARMVVGEPAGAHAMGVAAGEQSRACR